MLSKKFWQVVGNFTPTACQVLLKDGSQQENVWGADWYPEVKRVGFESLINIRPRQQNRSMEIKDPLLREKIEISDATPRRRKAQGNAHQDCEKSFGVKLMERKALYEKIKTQTWQQQLGNLASTLNDEKSLSVTLSTM